MGKNNPLTSMNDLRAEQKKIERKIKKIAVPCSHTKANGKVDFEFLGKGSLVKCKRCATVFDLDIIKDEQLDKAIRTIHNAVNQIKLTTDNPNKEENIIRTLGDLAFNLNEVKDLYQKAIKNFTKKGKKKKKNKYHDDFGSFGANNVNYLGGGKY